MKWLPSKIIIAFVVSLALFMEALDATILNTAIPAMAHSLKVHPVDLKIALISYLVSLAIFIPVSGWIADKFGIKRVFISALFIFTLSSFWCGYANNLTELVIARLIQGLGGSLMMPVGRLIILRTFERHELVQTMNLVVMVVALGIMFGPVLGGFITEHLSWHWIFWVNIPVGCFAMLVAGYWLQPVKPHLVAPFDFFGFLLFGSGLAGLTFAFSTFSETTADQLRDAMILLISLLLLVGYVVHSKKQKHPIVKTILFRYRTFQTSILGNLFSRLSFGGIPFLLPLLLQVGLGYSPQTSGLMMMPIAIGVLVVRPISLPLLRLLGYKRLLMLNTVLVGLSMWLFSTITHHTSVYLIGFAAFLYGFLISVQYSAMNSLAYADMPAENLSAATSIMSTTQQLAQSFGVAVGALLLRFFSTATYENFSLMPDIFRDTFLALGIITMMSAFIFNRLTLDDGNQMLAAPDPDLPKNT